MIEITRALARQFRAVLRKSTPASAARTTRAVLVLQAGKDGLYLRGQHVDAAVEYHLPGSRSPEILTLPTVALQDCEGGRDTVVTLEQVAQAMQVRWDDAGVPQLKEYPAADTDNLPPFPQAPARLTDVPTTFLKALDEAAETAAAEAVRFATHKVQLRGAKGEVVATDGRQLLVQGGFTFPWKEDLLIPALEVFGGKELPQVETVAVGRTEKHVCIKVGSWTFFLLVDSEGRFPNIDQIIPLAKGSATTCRLSPEDAAFLARALPRLPGRGEDNDPVTVDLDAKVAVRARAEGQERVAEVVLSHSEVSGPPVLFVTNRSYLLRAAQLGFTEFRILSADKPIVCRAERRTYLWVPLGADKALPPSEAVLRITSDQEKEVAPPPRERRKVEVTTPRVSAQRSSTVPPPRQTSDGTAHTPPGSGLGGLIEEAQAIKSVLRETYTRLARLVAGMKRHRRQSKLVSATLASLKALRQIED